jgi:DNA-binding SARP family transcriptional activator
MARLCARALEAGIEVAYVQDLVRTHRLLPDPPALTPAAWPWPVRLLALGAFAIERDALPEAPRGKAQQRPLALCKILIAFGGREVTEAQIVDALWPEAAGDTAHQAFATTLHRLRALLGDERGLRLREGRLSLDPRHVWLDIWAFEELLDRAEKDPSPDAPARSLLERALGLYRGPFLGAEGGAPWAISTSERLRSRFLRATSLLGRGWIVAGEVERAAHAYERGLAIDDLAEEFYQGLMTCHQRLGRRAEALRAYERCRERLAATLGVAPSATTERLHRAIRSG